VAVLPLLNTERRRRRRKRQHVLTLPL